MVYRLLRSEVTHLPCRWNGAIGNAHGSSLTVCVPMSPELRGISGQNPVAPPASTKAGQLLQEQMLFLVNHSQDSPMRQIGWLSVSGSACTVLCLPSGTKSPPPGDFYMKGNSVLHRAALQRRYFHRGYLLLLRTEPQLFQQGVPGYHGRKPAGVPAALPHGTGGTAADRKPPAHQHHQHHGQLPQSASTFPVRSKMYMASAYSYSFVILSPLYAFRFSDI